MWNRIKTKFESVSGTRRFAAGAVAFYVSCWLAEATLSFLWEKMLERETPGAVRQMSDLLATDLATGMAIMAMLMLFVPPIAGWIFDASAWLARYMELTSKRMSKRDYIYQISKEAIALSHELRAIAVQDRWTSWALIRGIEDGQEGWRRRQEAMIQSDLRKGEALQAFVTEKLGRANFLMHELVEFGFADKVDRVFEFIVNYHCAEELATYLERAGHNAQSALKRDGFNISITSEGGDKSLHSIPPA